MSSSFPTPQEIKSIATENGYAERREEISSTLFFKDVSNNTDDEYPTLVNIFYTTRGVMTKIGHPKRGYNELWRSDAYDSPGSLAAMFENPRTHTGRGYRTVEHALRGCAKCGLQKKRGDFSKNQWRKGPGHTKCADCVKQSQVEEESQDLNTTLERTESVEISREGIECDAGCGRSSPAVRCNRCLTVYYCSEDCQRRHRCTHMPDCRDINDVRAKHAMYSEQSKDHQHGRAMAAMLAGRSDFEGLLLQAQYYQQEMGNWEGSIEIYKSIFEEMMHQAPPQQLKVMMGLCRCFYEIEQYEKAIDLGMAAIEMNRHFPEVHKYVALAQKASGDLGAAKTTMERAVLYEAPWDDKNIEANKALLAEMLSGDA